jgi:hypothetical protein
MTRAAVFLFYSGFYNGAEGLQYPGRDLTKISKKKTRKELILKGERGDSSSFHCL